MIHAQTLVAAGMLAVAARIVSRTADPRRSRRRAAAGIGVVAGALLLAELLAPYLGTGHAVAALGTHIAVDSHGWQATAPFVDLVVALLAVGLAPIATHRPRTLAVILDVIAASMAFLAFTDPLPLTALWIVSILLVGAELRRLDQERGFVGLRAFSRYQSASVVAAVAGTVALLTGAHTFGAAAWLVAIGVREAALPFHGWLPRVMERAPLGLVVALIAPQPGVYAQLVMLGDLTGGSMAHGFAVVGAVTAVLGAALGLAQHDARRAVAWLIVSQTGLCAFGLENQSDVGRTGAVLSWQVMALAMSGFVMTLAALEARRGTLSLREPGGSFARTPRMAVAFLFLGFASVALPLTLGFVAEDLLVQGSVDEYPQVGFAVILATALNGMSVMRCFFTLFSGTRRHRGEHDLTLLEATALTVAMGVLLVGGVAPRIFVDEPPAAAGHR